MSSVDGQLQSRQVFQIFQHKGVVPEVTPNIGAIDAEAGKEECEDHAELDEGVIDFTLQIRLGRIELRCAKDKSNQHS